MRVMTAFALAISILLALAYAFGFAKADVSELCLYFLLAAFGGKSAQKFAESSKSNQVTKR